MHHIFANCPGSWEAAPGKVLLPKEVSIPGELMERVVERLTAFEALSGLLEHEETADIIRVFHERAKRAGIRRVEALPRLKLVADDEET